ncbi:uncharacterized protein LOC131018559 [Salvia miltiorrhiza]|uniref:uncharacterized protein LOC131018559 n=1 Tax=Salvia miltiorrhiza TaxID=226208 RepID=UPI0025ABF1D6|nr:uncharacterized protein LOC131018559 [Salvia miltiorrhiza]
MVENSWNSQIDVNCPIYKVMAKLKWLRKELRIWNRTVFGNVDQFISDSQQDLLEIQNLVSQQGYTDSLFNAEIFAQAKINVVLSRKNSLLKQKSRVSWLNDGDRNTAFFHAMLKYKKRHHIIPHLDIQGSMVYDQDEIGNHIVEFFSTLFTEDNMEEIDIVALEATIDHVVSPSQNDMLTRIPENDEITAAVFDMDPHSAAGLDGFSDVVNSLTDLRLIVLSNFLFKIISKVLAKRLSIVAMSCVSANQFGFISGRSIHECINRSNGGINMACKIDIKKAFDTLRWDFLLKVLRVAGYADQFVQWISIILRSARLSILYNGQLHGYFECTRGVRQGDPLSPILFGIAEDVLSALFKNCVESGHLQPMRMSRHTLFPTHLFYADDILVFGRATEANARTILHILNFYGSLSGQICSMEKSNIFFGDKVQSRLRRSIMGVLKFKRGTLPFIYLGVSIFAGAIKAIYLRAIHDRILLKFARWKGMHLSMARRICLVKSVIHSSITHSMMVYHWPKTLLKELDHKCRNFIWTGDIMKKPNCSVSWDRICAIKEEGCLGLRSFSLMNKCFLMKMAWSVICGQNFGHRIIKSRYLNIFCSTNNVLSSSIWAGLRPEIQDLVEDSYSYIAGGSSINFWRDDWLGYKLVDRCRVPFFVWDHLSSSVADYFYDGIWHFTQDFLNNYQEIVCDILLLPIGSDSDTRFWMPSVHGKRRLPSIFSGNAAIFSLYGGSSFSGLSSMISLTIYTVFLWLRGTATPARRCELFGKLVLSLLSGRSGLSVMLASSKTKFSTPNIFFKLCGSLSKRLRPPVSHWIKVNTDGSASGAPRKIATGGVFRDNVGWVRGCFHYKGGTGFAFEAELLAVIMAIQIAHSRGWFALWVESDSTYIVNLLNTRSNIVPWRFVASWNKILVILQDFNIQISHIYREGNVPADIMANENMTEGWWPHEVEEIKKAVRLDMACHSHLGFEWSGSAGCSVMEFFFHQRRTFHFFSSSLVIEVLERWRFLPRVWRHSFVIASAGDVEEDSWAEVPFLDYLEGTVSDS